MNRARAVAGWLGLVCAVVVMSRFIFDDSWGTAIKYALAALVLTGVLYLAREAWWQILDRQARRRQR
jgi:Flp pilus assembly protein TadG